MADDAHRVVHLSESAGRYVQPSGGPLTGDVVELVRPELRFELRTALHRVFDQRRSTLSLPILVQFNGAPHPVQLLVRLVQAQEETPPKALVLFIEGDPIEGGVAQPDRKEANEETIRRLTEELALTQERLRTIREESDAANEELRASNEELQSINEEYRSTSEELETSKEELQSINEELQTVNSELKQKLELVSRSNSDLLNLMAATEFGTLFLDSNLRIKRFTDRATDLFSITPADEGRLITDFAHRLEYDDLVKDARAVLADLAPIRREVRSRDGRWHDVRLRPYRTVDDKIDGVVITFVDLTDRRHIEEALRESERQLLQQKLMVELSREPIFIWDFDNGIVDWNRGCAELYGYKREEALGRNTYDLLGTTVPGSSFAELRSTLEKEGSWTGSLRHRTKEGRELIVEGRLELESLGDRRLVLESTRDVTERRRHEEEQQIMLRELAHRSKNLLAVVQAMIRQAAQHTDLLEDFTAQLEGRIGALSQANDLLLEQNWRGAPLQDLIRGQLAPFVEADADRVTLAGPPLALGAQAAQQLALALHELATNACKYGAFSRQGGTVHIDWAIDAGEDGKRRFRLAWAERGGPPVQRPKRRGFGTLVLERLTPTGLNGSAELRYDPGGLEWVLRSDNASFVC